MANGYLNKFSPLHIFVLAAILLTSCGQVDQAGLETTARVMTLTTEAKTLQAEHAAATQEAIPTCTWVPTMTPLASSTQQTIESSTPTSETNLILTSESASTSNGSFPTYTPLPFMAAWKVSSIRFVNNSGKTVHFTLYGAEVIDLTIGKTLIVKVRFDTYYFTAYIGKDGPYNGSIFINNVDRYTIFIDEDNIRVAYP